MQRRRCSGAEAVQRRRCSSASATQAAGAHLFLPPHLLRRTLLFLCFLHPCDRLRLALCCFLELGQLAQSGCCLAREQTLQASLFGPFHRFAQRRRTLRGRVNGGCNALVRAAMGREWARSGHGVGRE